MITLGQVQRDVILVWFLSYGVLRSICIHSVFLDLRLFKVFFDSVILHFSVMIHEVAKVRKRESFIVIMSK